MAEVRFIRRHGKIIPIRSKDKTKKGKKSKKNKGGKGRQLAAGAATSAAGIGVGIAGGKTTRKASSLSKRAGKKAGQATKASFKASERALRTSKTGQLDLFRTVSSGERAKRLAGQASKLRKAAVRFEKVATRSKLFTLALGGSLLGAGIENILEASNSRKNVAKEVAKDFSVNLASGVVAGAFVLGASKAGLRTSSAQILKRIRTSIKGSKQLSLKL